MQQLLMKEQTQQLQEAAKGLMTTIINTLLRNGDYSNNFGAPVWKQFPEIKKEVYLQGIAPNEPMDLGTIRDRVKKGGKHDVSTVLGSQCCQHAKVDQRLSLLT
jgi:hypothetical protein